MPDPNDGDEEYWGTPSGPPSHIDPATGVPTAYLGGAGEGFQVIRSYEDAVKYLEKFANLPVEWLDVTDGPDQGVSTGNTLQTFRDQLSASPGAFGIFGSDLPFEPGRMYRVRVRRGGRQTEDEIFTVADLTGPAITAISVHGAGPGVGAFQVQKYLREVLLTFWTTPLRTARAAVVKTIGIFLVKRDSNGAVIRSTLWFTDTSATSDFVVPAAGASLVIPQGWEVMVTITGGVLAFVDCQVFTEDRQ